MRIDKYGQVIFTEKDLVEYYLKNPEDTIGNALVETKLEFPIILGLENIPDVRTYIEPNISIDQFDSNNQRNWYMPQNYKDLDIAKYILELCTNDSELQRAGQELLLFQERNMFDLLKYLKYLVDTMRENNIVWGVGRGSSVSSFVLYLLGVHKINSLYYDLSIDEFLK